MEIWRWSIKNQGQSLPSDPTAMSWLEQPRLKHETQCGRAIFLIIYSKGKKQNKKKHYKALQKYFQKLAEKKQNSGRGEQEEEL